MIEIPKSISSAVELQTKLAKKLVFKDVLKSINFVGGVDIHYKDKNIILGYVILSYPSGEVLDKKIKVFNHTFDFPYIPEFLCFSEGLYIIEFLNKLDWQPDILVLDGHGIAHPRRFGLASYVGVMLDVPTIGCAKKLLYGRYVSKLGMKRGSCVDIIDEKTSEVIGCALRTKDNVKEIIVSVGHKVSLDIAKNVVLKLSKYRIPQPIRLAHIIAKTGVV